LTYLDTLPRLETLVMQLGEPAWASLITDADGYVDGGQEWGPESFGKGQLSVGAHEDALLLELHHEDFPTVRTFTAPLARETGSKIPVSLAVSISPAQGNARVEVIPDEADLWGRKRVLLNWKSMHDTGKTPEERLDEHPRICPPLVIRPSSWARWSKVEESIRDIESKWKRRGRRELLQDLQWLNQELQQPDPNQQFHYAVNSEGEVRHKQDLLDRLVDEMIAEIQRREEDRVFEYCFRVLANTFTADHRFQDILAKKLKGFWHYDPYELLAIGRCLREPELVAEYCGAVERKLNSTHEKVSNWLRALSEVIKYRDNALHDVKPDVGHELTEHVLAVFAGQIELRNGNVIFKHAIVAILYLLRIRRYDDSFLPPDSDLARRVKKSCLSARRLARSGQLRLMGGQVDLAACLDEVIAYIDRKGRGIPILAMID